MPPPGIGPPPPHILLQLQQMEAQHRGAMQLGAPPQPQQQHFAPMMPMPMPPMPPMPPPMPMFAAPAAMAQQMQMLHAQMQWQDWARRQGQGPGR